MKGYRKFKKNMQINSFFAKSVPASCIINFLDLCNHHPIKSKNQAIRPEFEVFSKSGHFIVKIEL